jgi:hypothetical protein
MFLCVLYLIYQLFGVQFLTIDLIVGAGGEYELVSIISGTGTAICTVVVVAQSNGRW